MKLEEVLTRLEDPNTTPGQLSATLMYLSADYARKTEELQKLLVKKVAAWPQLRLLTGSDKQADKAWDATPDGIAESSLKLQLRSYEKLMSALRTHLRNKETEARNMY